MGVRLAAVEAREAKMRKMRQSIMALASRRGWDYDQFHDLMESWGYGRSLRKLSYGELNSIRRFLTGEDARLNGYFTIGVLDAQGRYMWSLMKQAGWDWKRVRTLMVKRYSATHWNALKYDEKRAVIATLRRYADRARSREKSSSKE